MDELRIKMRRVRHGRWLMKGQLALILLTACQGVAWSYHCVNFGPDGAGSECVSWREARELVNWENAPEARPDGKFELLSVSEQFFEPALRGKALLAGIRTEQPARLKVQVQGKHFVEVYVISPQRERYGFRLKLDGKVVDGRLWRDPERQRLRPKQGTELLALYVWLPGTQAAELTVETNAPEYGLAALKLFRAEEFERKLVPDLLERARKLQHEPMYHWRGENPFARARYLVQLWERLVWSKDEEVRREATIGLGRAYYWIAAENHEPFDIDKARYYIERSLELAPENPVVQQVASAACLGLNVGRRPMARGRFCEEVKPIEWSIQLPAIPADAPRWAVTQLKLHRRMHEITRWWVEERQQANGELGGGWGDDVEILRSWGHEALGFGCEVAARGIRLLADGIWRSDTIVDGYNRSITDVEHSAEPTTDTQPLAVALEPDNEELLERLYATAQCMKNWIARQPDGFYRFRSSWFNCREVDPNPGRAIDVYMNLRALGPALWYLRLRRDPELLDLLAKWGEAWAHAMRQTEHGKPFGIFPSAMWARDGSYLVNSQDWARPDAEWDYYQWSGQVQDQMIRFMLALYELTGEQKWLEAVLDAFKPSEACQRGELPGWLCRELEQTRPAYLVLKQYVPAAARFADFFDASRAVLVEADLEKLAAQAEQLEKRLSVNFDMFTREVLFTDRVYYSLPVDYARSLFGGLPPHGDSYPVFAVSWPANQAWVSRAVMTTGAEHVVILLYSFEETEISLPVRLWRVKPGVYTCIVREGGPVRRLVSRRIVQVKKAPKTIEVQVPPYREVELAVEKVAKTSIR